MNEILLKKTRLGTTLAAVILGSILWFAVSPPFAAGFALSALWAVAGFWVLERLLRSAILPAGSRRNRWAAAGWLCAKLALYGLALWCLFQKPFPALSHVFGLTLLLVVLVAVGIAVAPRATNQPVRRGNDG